MLEFLVLCPSPHAVSCVCRSHHALVQDEGHDAVYGEEHSDLAMPSLSCTGHQVSPVDGNSESDIEDFFFLPFSSSALLVLALTSQPPHKSLQGCARGE